MTIYAKVGADALVNTTTSYDQHQSVAARLNDGSVLVVWADTGTIGGANDSTIRGQRYAGTGEKIGGEIVISTIATSDVREPAITALPNGEYVVTWSFWTGSNDSWTDIHGRRFAADGTPVGSEFVVTSTADNQTESKVIPIATGGFVATWLGWAGSPPEMHIVSQRFDASGNKVGGEDILNPGGGGNPSGPSVSTHDTGHVISWTDQGRALARFFDTDGTPIGNEVVIDDVAYTSRLSVKELGDGSLIFSWLRQDQDSVLSYVAQKYDAQGAKVGPEIFLHDPNIDTIQITPLDNGAFLAAWVVFNGDVGTSTILTQLFDQDGQKAGPEHKAYTSSAYITQLSLTTGSGGRVLASWTSHDPASQDYESDIRSMVLGPAADPVNVAPVVTGVTILPTGAEDVPVVITAAQLLGNASDPDGDVLSVIGLTVTGGGGTLADNGDGTWTYTPASNHSGSVSLSYRVSDGSLTTSTSAVMSINPQNDAPDGITMSGGSVLENSRNGTEVATFLGSDIDGDALIYTLLADGGGRYAIQGQTLVVANSGVLDYEQRSSDTVTVRATDAHGAYVDRAFTINLHDVLSENVIGSSSADILVGGAGSDRLNGGAGNDSLIGAGGTDYLNGGTGKDTLRGDAGKDYFVFDTKLDAKTNVDKIVDFIVKDDTIQIDNLYFKKAGKGTVSKPGKLNSDMFTIGSKAKDAEDRIIYDNKKGYIYYDADGTGSSKAVLFATVSKNLKMTASDFLVI